MTNYSYSLSENTLAKFENLQLILYIIPVRTILLQKQLFLFIMKLRFSKSRILLMNGIPDSRAKTIRARLITVHSQSDICEKNKLREPAIIIDRPMTFRYISMDISQRRSTAAADNIIVLDNE